MNNVLTEIVREIPPEVAARHGRGASPVFIAHGCVLLERFTGKSYAYRAVNLKNNKSAEISRRAKPMPESDYETAALKIRASGIAGASRYTVDKPPGEKLECDELAEIQDIIFKKILPMYGYGLREKQVELAGHILNAICRRAVSLSETEVGTGKTHAYLIAAALAKRSRVNDFWLRGTYTGQSYASSAYMPVVVSTSSIALQKAIVTDYIPEISRILMERIIRNPLTCVIRKGKEHYVCEKNLRAFIHFERDSKLKKILEGLLEKNSVIDLGDVDGLKPYVRRKIGVSGRCGDECPHYNNCRYMRHMKRAQSGEEYDFQVCNHNYLLADTLRRSKGQNPLIPHYQTVIIDEAHKFLSAARDMYGAELDAEAFPRLKNDICSLTFRQHENSTSVRRLAVKLESEGRRLFRLLNERIPETNSGDETERYKTVLGEQAERHLHNIRNITDELRELLSGKLVLNKYSGKCTQILWELADIRDQAAVFAKREDIVYWLEKPETVRHRKPDEPEIPLLRAIPKKLNKMLHRDIWNKRVPVVLTSGTLSAGGSFDHIKRNTGLNLLREDRLLETSKPSPFNHKENALIYISETMPFPDNKDKRYIAAVTDETEKLIRASHGHGAVLFTLYNNDIAF